MIKKYEEKIYVTLFLKQKLKMEQEDKIKEIQSKHEEQKKE